MIFTPGEFSEKILHQASGAECSSGKYYHNPQCLHVLALWRVAGLCGTGRLEGSGGQMASRRVLLAPTAAMPRPPPSVDCVARRVIKRTQCDSELRLVDSGFKVFKIKIISLFYNYFRS